MGDIGQTDGKMVWDLRQVYAEIVGLALRRTAEAQFNKNIQEYYSALMDLYVNVAHKIHKEERKRLKANKDIKTFTDLNKDFLITANLNKSTFQGQDNGSERMNSLLLQLATMHKLILDLMDGAGMFGEDIFEQA